MLPHPAKHSELLTYSNGSFTQLSLIITTTGSIWMWKIVYVLKEYIYKMRRNTKNYYWGGHCACAILSFSNKSGNTNQLSHRQLTANCFVSGLALSSYRHFGKRCRRASLHWRTMNGHIYHDRQAESRRPKKTTTSSNATCTLFPDTPATGEPTFL